MDKKVANVDENMLEHGMRSVFFYWKLGVAFFLFVCTEKTIYYKVVKVQRIVLCVCSVLK